MRHTILLLCLSAFLLSFPATASAFCRTRTVKIPAGYDPTVSGCMTGGVPLYWADMPVTYELNQAASSQISLDAATQVIDASFAKWAQVSCTTDGGPAHPALSFQRQAPTNGAFVACTTDADVDAEACDAVQAAGPHQIIFRDDAWPYNDSMNEIALTTVTFGTTLGDIRSANTEINTFGYPISTTNPPPSGAYSLAAIMDHEAGHFIGLAHAEEKTAVMYAMYALTQPPDLSLQTDDIAGVCTIYPPSTTHGCMVSPSGPAHDASGVGIIALGVGLAVTAATRRRRQL